MSTFKPLLNTRNPMHDLREGQGPAGISGEQSPIK